jgi:hypothetical protein
VLEAFAEDSAFTVEVFGAYHWSCHMALQMLWLTDATVPAQAASGIPLAARQSPRAQRHAGTR